MVGKTISHYQVIEKLGEGGMGVVYKARDTHLDRFVAIKVLPPEKVTDPERKRRFVQEAKAASALNHPNIITVHDIDAADGVDYIVMEYVAGKTLDELIPRKGMRLNEALKQSVEIADALAKAHAAGIIHRDLKPGNVMVTAEGRVKVLDFGLAKLTEASPLGEDESTRTMKPTTEAGKVVGTVSYMSPEQAEGRPVDARSDIFSIGSLLYEMIAGRRAFQGNSKVATLAAIIKEEPAPLAAEVPRDLQKLITRCLRKDPSRRFQTMADLKVALEELKEESDSGALEALAAGKPKRRRLWPAATALAVALLAAGTWLVISKRRPVEAPLRAVPITSYPGSETHPSFSPDGNYVAFARHGEDGGHTDIYVQGITGGGSPHRLTTDPASDYDPAWSPDGSSIAFLRMQKDKRQLLLIPALGGPEKRLVDLPLGGGYLPWIAFLAWSPDGKYLVYAGGSGLLALSPVSGEQRELTSLGGLAPAFSPDGGRLAFVRPISFGVSYLYLLPLTRDLRPSGEPRRLVVPHSVAHHPAWTGDGSEIIYSAGGMGNLGLWRVNAAGSGAPRPLGFPGDTIWTPQVSRNGRRLAYAAASVTINLQRVDIPSRAGNRPVEIAASTHQSSSPQYSPDGRRLAFSSSRSGNSEIWVCDADGSNPVQLTSLGAYCGTPRWFPDGRRIVFDSDKQGHSEVFVIDAAGGAPRRLTNSPANSSTSSVSGDGKRIYFTSNRTGRGEVWRMPAEGGEATQITRQGGLVPVESADGRRIYYLKETGQVAELWTVSVEGGEETKILDSVALRAFEVRPDGIYFITPEAASSGYSLRFFSFGEKASKEVARVGGQSFLGLAISPDGRSAVYSQVTRLDADLMLVDNFR